MLQAVGVRVYGRVVGPLHPRLAVGHLSLSLGSSVATQFDGSVDAHVRFTVANPGNTVLSPVATVELTTPFGTAARRTLTIGQLLPGNALAYGLDFPGVSSYSHLHATVTVTAPRATASATVTAWAVPWALLVVVLSSLSSPLPSSSGADVDVAVRRQPTRSSRHDPVTGGTTDDAGGGRRMRTAGALGRQPRPRV